MAAAFSLSAFAQGYKDGVEYYNAGRIELAQELLEKNLASASNKAEAYYYLGSIQLDYYFYDLKRNKTADAGKELAAAAKDYFQKGLAADPEYAFNYAGMGTVALINNNSKEAETNFKNAEKRANKDAGVYAAIARGYYNVGNNIHGNPDLYKKQIDKAMASAEKLMYKRITAAAGKADFQPNDADYYLLRGDIIFDTAGADKKLVGDACNEYERAITVNPEDGAAYVKYADTYFEINPNLSISKLRELLSKNPNSALGQRELAEKLYKDGMVADATKEYAKLMKNPNHFTSDENRYLELLYFAKDFQNGFDAAQSLLNSNPNQAGALSWKYVFAHELGRPDVVEIGEQLLASQEKNGSKLPYGIYPMLARDFNKAGKSEEAINVLKLGLQQYPDNLDMLKESASALAALNRYSEAADMLSEFTKKKNASEVSGTEFWTLSQYAIIAGQDATDAAVQTNYFKLSADAARAAESKLAAQFKYLVHKRLGDIAQIEKNDATAAAEYAIAIKQLEDANAVADNTKDAAAMYRYAGVAAYNAKDMAQAANYLRKYQALVPDDAAINSIVSKLK